MSAGTSGSLIPGKLSVFSRVGAASRDVARFGWGNRYKTHRRRRRGGTRGGGGRGPRPCRVGAGDARVNLSPRTTALAPRGTRDSRHLKLRRTEPPSAVPAAPRTPFLLPSLQAHGDTLGDISRSGPVLAEFAHRQVTEASALATAHKTQ